MRICFIYEKKYFIQKKTRKKAVKILIEGKSQCVEEVIPITLS